ncbi:hypothetical protein VIN01S_30560 [Vibrio inusitatus NBRC 102082]|uniref:DUF58 domain-containing protein n=1 Tax=Vibrio inusitatus NBRC 102082 TaxID=1219070 RepID=A0A4Y3I057_9VIBR|nr:DUF58 domain-containing protein [Vibrio inusitatus]GEA52252.1 hypothetical protein VIN01S_30560 [Vibrio inusitatus NBRC 102082]
MTEVDRRVYVDKSTLLGLQFQAQKLAMNNLLHPSGIFSGSNRSRLRGQGFNFEELRPYRTGDNIKNIDWKASSRSHSRVVKVFTQETDRPAIVVCDQRPTMFFGSRVYMKSVVAAHLASLMIWMLYMRGDRVAGVVLGPEQMQSQNPSRAMMQITQFIANVVTQNQMLGKASNKALALKNDLSSALARALPMLGSSGTLVLITDSLSVSDSELSTLKLMSARHNVIVLLVNDALELDYKTAKDLVISDGRSQLKLDTAKEDILQYQQAMSEQLVKIRKSIGHSGLPFASFNTEEEPFRQLNLLLKRGR